MGAMRRFEVRTKKAQQVPKLPSSLLALYIPTLCRCMRKQLNASTKHKIPCTTKAHRFFFLMLDRMVHIITTLLKIVNGANGCEY